MQFWSFWFSQAPMLSILIPFVTAILLLALGNPGAGQLRQDPRLPLRRCISLLGAVLGVAVAISYFYLAQTGSIVVYRLGEWYAPFGIVLVLDRLSAMMVLLSSVMGLVTLFYASRYWDLQGRYFHAMLHLLLMGLQGAFLTGDLFNLFVFFEILLIASYVLLLHGQGKARFQTGIHYVAINLLASALFLIGLGFIYGNVGSLNMADVARILPQLSGTTAQLASVGALLLFVVFGIKAAMLPLGFWLPKSYAVASPPVAVIFTLMTKVGVYALLRVNGLVFAESTAFAQWQNWLLGLGLLGSLIAIMAALAAKRFKRFVGFMVLSSVSTLLIALSLMSANALAAMLYYLLHSTLIAAAFYLLSEWIYLQRGAAKDHLRVSDRMSAHVALGYVYFVLAWMLAGLPPFTGFMGKFMLLQAALGHPQQIWIFSVVLIVSLISILALSRVGFILFWKARHHDQASPTTLVHMTPTHSKASLTLLGCALVGMLVFTPQIYRYSLATAQQLLTPQAYIHAVLHRNAQGQTMSVQAFDPNYVPVSKYDPNRPDPLAGNIPYSLSPATLQGEHIDLPASAPALPQQSIQEQP